MLIFFVFVKLLSLMTNTHVWINDHTGWKTRWRRHARSHQRSLPRVRHLHRKYAGCGWINDLQGQKCPCQTVDKVDMKGLLLYIK